MMKKNKLFIYFFLLLSCDFTTSIHRDILKAQEYFQEKNYQEAIKYYKSVSDKRINKDLKIKVYYQLAEIYSNYEEKYDISISYYEKILSYSPDLIWQVKIYEKLGEVYFLHQKKYGEAIKVYEKLYSFNPPLENNDFYLFRIGLAHFQDKNYFKSTEIFGNISKQNLHTYFVESLYYLGLINFYQKDWKSAVEQWKVYLKHEREIKKIINVKFLIANSYEMLEELKTAYNIYFSILSDYPNPKVIEKRLRSLYERRVSRKR